MIDYRETCKKILGEDIFQTLKKFEIYKKGSNTALNPEEIKIAMQVVPRAVMSFLIRELTPMAVDDVKEIELPFAVGARMNINKKDKDNYSGEIIQNNGVAYDFKFRSLPGVGLLILSTFELYDLKDLKEYKNDAPKFDTEKIQNIIDERLKTYDLINSVVNNKMSVRDARDEFINQKLNGIIMHMEAQRDLDEKQKEKPSKLKRFLDRKKDNEFSLVFEKSEEAKCSDCGSKIFDNNGWNGGCICVGEDRNKKVWLKKTEDGVKIRFSKGWDPENIELLLESIERIKNETHS